ncbi:MAG: aldo/keto reductase [Nitrososphaerota archaeon]|nr:aldo/keto reductase [Nitrososphaerota archaeon]MDG7049225.1 aldo/keto reductase [Nitrososphaerota archaeon]MDG7051747.1 aldo/keto reductase [Nitrososphaerota archaeon]
MNIERINLGRSDLMVSRIGLGTWQASYKQWGEDVQDLKIIDAIKKSIELGINLIDTAELYGKGHSEKVIGSAIKGMNREEVVIASKVYGAHLRYDELLKSAEMSMNRLGVKYLDLYQIHWPDPWEQIPLKETMKAMEKLYVEGKIRAIGVSNFAVRDMEEAASHLSKGFIASNQVRYNMLQREVEEEVLPYCKRNSITVMAWSPLAQGALTGKYSQTNVPKDRIRSDNKLFKKENLESIQKLLNVMSSLAKAYKKNIAQVALNWLLKDRIVVPIPGAKTPEQAESNAMSCDWSLNAGDLKLIAEVLAGIDLDYM